MTLGALQRVLIGDPLPTDQKEHQRLGKIKALAVFSSDALSSVAYATEEILLVLVLAGPAALHLSIPIAVTITALLLIVVSSYYHTIQAYPAGAGAYIVSRENLGTNAGLTAAAALLLDYILTVSVSISAGIVALTSAFPELLPYRVDLCVGMIFLIAVANLRGVKESGTIFSIPTYAFLAIFITLLITGLYKLFTGGIVPHEAVVNAHAEGAATLGILLILRAFASGCTALTGIEAVSDGVAAFKRPEARNASITLFYMAGLLCFMFIGVTYLAFQLGVTPVAHESVVSQIGREVFGEGSFYYVLQAATMLILILAANTSFADFPRLSSFIARDGFLPRQMGNLGDRLVYSNGIIALAFLASLLVIIFDGNPHSLIPLYAVGVFLSFTLSQAGMVRRWMQLRPARWRVKAFVNGFGAICTGIVTIVIIESKLIYGAWAVLIIIPILVSLFRKIKAHYVAVEDEMRLPANAAQEIGNFSFERQHKVIIPVAMINRATIKALQFARSLSQDVKAVTVDIDPTKTDRLRQSWAQQIKDVELIVLSSPYRSVIGPIMDYLDEVDDFEPERGLAVVILPEIVPGRWWQHLLHNQTALLLKGVLLLRGDRHGHDRIVINVPYRVLHSK